MQRLLVFLGLVFGAVVAAMLVQLGQTSLARASGNCDRAYPGVCIPSPPPNLNCKDIPYRKFKVLSPDPHRFDRDKDGIGCESKK
jgi:hypothetical protein